MDIDTKIEIKTQNKRHYYDIALLVDKPNFIKWILDLRKKWKIDKLFSPENYNDFYSHIWKVSGKSWSSFRKDIENVRANFGRLPNFDDVIMYAIVSAEIPEGVYKSCYLEQIVEPGDPEQEDESKYKYAIIVTPNTTLDDLAEVLKKYKSKIKVGLKQKKNKDEMDKAVAEYKFELGPNYTPPPHGIDNVIRDRNWYWLKKKHSYSKVLELTKKQDEVISRDGVIKAIKAYTERLVES